VLTKISTTLKASEKLWGGDDILHVRVARRREGEGSRMSQAIRNHRALADSVIASAQIARLHGREKRQLCLHPDNRLTGGS
jgi:hypothetical protein